MHNLGTNQKILSTLSSSIFGDKIYDFADMLIELNKKNFKYTADAEIVESLKFQYKPNILQLQDLLKRDLSSWY